MGGPGTWIASGAIRVGPCGSDGCRIHRHDTTGTIALWLGIWMSRKVFGGLVGFREQERLVPVGPAGFEGAGETVFEIAGEFQDGFVLFGWVVFVAAGDGGVVPAPGEFVILEPGIGGSDVHIVGVLEVGLGDFEGQVTGVIVIVPRGTGEFAELILIPKSRDEGVQKGQMNFGGDFVGEDLCGGIDDPGTGRVADQVDVFESAGNREDGLGQARAGDIAGVFCGVFGIDNHRTVFPVEEGADPFVGIGATGDLAGGIFGPVMSAFVDPAMRDDHQTITGEGKLDRTGPDDFGVGCNFGLEDHVLVKEGT